MDIYEINYTNPDMGDLYAISIVDDPATGYNFITLSNKKENLVEVKLADKKKQLLVGVALVPEQLIERIDENGKRFQIKFSAPTIERLSQDFMAKNYQKNSTYNHVGDFLNGITVVESWLIEDSEKDKSTALGFSNLPKGTWMVTMKLSDELWSKYIETGKAKGFSIDSYLDLKKIIMNNNKKEIMKKNNKGFFSQIVNLFKTENMLSEVNVEGMGMLTAESFEIGSIVYKDVDGVMEPLVSQSFEADGFKFTTDELGTIITKEEILPSDTIVESGLTPTVSVNMDSEQIGEFETADGMKVYCDWLTIGKVVTNDKKEVLSNVTFEVDGLFYSTDSTGEIVKTEKNADSPLWVVEMTVAADEAISIIDEDVSVIEDEITKPLEEIDVEALKTLVSELNAKIEIITTEKETIINENTALKEQLSKIPNSTKLKANLSSDKSKPVTQMDYLREILNKAK